MPQPIKTVVAYYIKEPDQDYFRGWLKIGKSKFNYQLIVESPAKPPGNKKSSKKKKKDYFIFKISLEKNEKPIDLTTDEQDFFCMVLQSILSDLYENPFCYYIIENGILGKHLIFFEPADIISVMLNQPKFDCNI